VSSARLVEIKPFVPLHEAARYFQTTPDGIARIALAHGFDVIRCDDRAGLAGEVFGHLTRHVERGTVTLSPRLAGLLALLADGLESREIAITLGLSIFTVQNEVAILYRKLGATNRAHAVAQGFRLGLLV